MAPKETVLRDWYNKRYHVDRPNVTEILSKAEDLGLWKEEDFLWKVSRICNMFSHEGQFYPLITPSPRLS